MHKPVCQTLALCYLCSVTREVPGMDSRTPISDFISVPQTFLCLYDSCQKGLKVSGALVVSPEGPHPGSQKTPLCIFWGQGHESDLGSKGGRGDVPSPNSPSSSP